MKKWGVLNDYWGVKWWRELKMKNDDEGDCWQQYIMKWWWWGWLYVSVTCHRATFWVLSRWGVSVRFARYREQLQPRGGSSPSWSSKHWDRWSTTSRKIERRDWNEREGIKLLIPQASSSSSSSLPPRNGSIEFPNFSLDLLSVTLSPKSTQSLLW